MLTLTQRTSVDDLDLDLQEGWHWSHQQLGRVRGAFAPALPNNAAADSSATFLERGLAYTKAACLQTLLGLSLPFIGARYILRHRRLWKWALSPVFVAAVVLFGVLSYVPPP